MSDYGLMLARLTNVPLMVTADYFDTVLGLLSARRGMEHRWLGEAPEATEGARYRAMQDRDDRSLHEGLALIGVDGSLAHKSGPMQGLSSTMRSYGAIRRDFDAALADERVEGIVFDIDSPGGEASGNFALAEYIAAQRGRKPTLALADEFATSAAYNIAAAADTIVAPPGALLGSIGVILGHVSEARALADEGLDVTLIRAGARKAEGHPAEPLTTDANATLQARVNRVYGRFVGLVARHRGIDAEAVRATEARVYDAEEALDLGLIDSVMSVDNALISFSERARDRSVDRTTIPVSRAFGPTPTTHVEESTMSAEQGAEPGTTVIDEVARAADNEAAVQAARTEAATAERARITAIYALPSANASDAHRTMAGEYIALGMSVEQCDGLLKKMPVPEKQVAAIVSDDTDTLGALMARDGADVDQIEGTLSEKDEDPEATAALVAASEYRRDTESHIRYATAEERV